MATGDFNGDGVPDVAVSTYYGAISLFLGDGKGRFQARRDLPVGGMPGFIAVGDFNGDGHLDLAVTDSLGNYLSVLLGEGDGTFQAPRRIPARFAQSIAVGNFDGDGIADLVVIVADHWCQRGHCSFSAGSSSPSCAMEGGSY